MNSLKVKIMKIANYDYINLIQVSTNNLELNVITLQLNEKVVEGMEVSILFKESEVIITKDFGSSISIENVIPSNVIEVIIGNVFSEIILDSMCGIFKALITLESLKKIGIYKGEKVFALIKSNEIALGFD